MAVAITRRGWSSRRRRWWSPWSEGAVAICGDAAHPMMPNLGQVTHLLVGWLVGRLVCRSIGWLVGWLR